VDRWLNAPTDDYGDLPETHPPVGVAPMRPAQPLPDADTPPNMPAWPAAGHHRNVRADITHERRDDGGWS
jgi:hypothetical protein